MNVCVTAIDTAFVDIGIGGENPTKKKKGNDMDGEQNGTQTQQVEDAQQQGGEAQGSQQQQETQGQEQAAAGSSVDAAAYEAQLAERDSRIAELEQQIADAAKSAEAADALREEIAALKQQGADERIEFSLLLAGCRNVKAAKAVLDDHGGDVDALKEAEPWMFQDAPAKQSGKTGLSNAGVAADEGKDVKHWRKLAGLDDNE